MKKSKPVDKLRHIDPETMEYNLRRILGNDTMRLPDSYLVLDLETTNAEPASGYIWQIGMYPVLHGTAQCDQVMGETIYLKLPDYQLQQAEFEICLRRAKKLGIRHIGNETDAIAKLRDKTYVEAEEEFITEVQEKGVEPKLGMQTFIDIVQSYVDNAFMLVGQNMAKFDLPFIEYNCKKYSINFRFPNERLLDTGMLIKASVLGRRILGRETSREFYARVGAERAWGVFFALERFCLPYWNMEEKYGIDVTKAHNAGYDCYITHLVLDEIVGEVLRYRGVSNYAQV